MAGPRGVGGCPVGRGAATLIDLVAGLGGHSAPERNAIQGSMLAWAVQRGDQ